MKSTLLVTIDSLRADHVSHLGYERETTPNIDRYAEKGATFRNAFAHAGSTRPSFPSILTSAYALMYGGYQRVSEEQRLISEVFNSAGYQCAGFHSNLYLGSDFGYDRGFNKFYDSKTDPSTTARIRQAVKDWLDEDGLVYKALARGFDVAERRTGTNVGSAYVPANEITNRAIDWVDAADNDQPHLLWVHYMDVHHPYVPPADHQRRFREEPISERRAIKLRRKMLEDPQGITNEELDDIIDLYDAEIRFADEEIGRLVERTRECWGEVNLLITSDHGEEFREHGKFSHHAQFYDELLHVPLVLNDGKHTGEFDELVGLLDVSPTLVDLAGLDSPQAFHGQSLRKVFDENWERSAILGDWENTETGEKRFSYRSENWKYIQTESEEELYNLSEDPGETVNLIEGEAAVVERCRTAIREHREEIKKTDTDLSDVDMEEQVKQRLRNLGYNE